MRRPLSSCFVYTLAASLCLWALVVALLGWQGAGWFAVAVLGGVALLGWLPWEKRR